MRPSGWILARDFTAQLAGGKRLAGLLALALSPAALLALLRWLEPGSAAQPADALRWRCFVWISCSSLLLQGVGLWLAFSLSASVATEEPGEGGLEYALSRSIARSRIFLWRLFACAFLVAALLLLGQAAAAGAAFAGTGILSGPGFARGFAALAGAQLLAAALYAALGALLALLTTRPLVYGLLYFFFGEMVLASMPDKIVGRFTLLYHLRSLVARGFAEIPEVLLKEMLFPLVPPEFAAGGASALGVLLLAAAAAAALGAWQFSVREWTAPRHER